MTDEYAGQSIGLPANGRGALASWGARAWALVIDWFASMLVAMGAFGVEVMTQAGWKSFMTLAVFFIQSCLFTAFTGSSFGQLISKIGVVRLDHQPLGWWRPIVRSALKCVVIPVVVVGAERRHLADMMLGTAVVNRR